MKCTSFSCKALIWTQEKKKQPRISANPPFGRCESDLLILTFAIQLRCLAHPSSGAFGQILSPPRRLLTAIPLSLSFGDYQKRTIISYVMINEHLSHRRRWGADRICPNAPDEGTSRRVDSGLDAESGRPQPSKSLICEGHDERE